MARADATRELRLIIGGAAIVLLALVTNFAVLPFVRRYQSREVALTATRARVRFLSELTSRTADLESAAADAERALSAQSRRVFHARTSTLAASALQTFLQDAADASHLAVTRLEVSPDDSVRADGSTPDGSGNKTADQAEMHIPASMSAYGDIRGVVMLLDFIAAGPRVVSIDRLSLTRNSALVGAADVVQITLSMRAPALPQ